ncbi:MAG TPA: response regulator [Burkholderiales bacterium]|nr:response regulator [Burkholderiales bacterium]
MRILIIEDDPLLGDGLQSGLKHLGFAPDWVRDGVAARNALATEEYGALVLDLGLPRLSGLDLLRQVRAAGNEVPVLILTARDALQDKLAGLDAGADDYLVKPVDVQELAARLRALIRRSGGRAAPVIRCADVELDPAARRVRRRGEPVEISAKELAILELLMANAGRVMSRAQLEAALYGWGEGAESNAVEVFIHHLRRKLGQGFIRTLRGIGYMVEKDR